MMLARTEGMSQGSPEPGREPELDPETEKLHAKSNTSKNAERNKYKLMDNLLKTPVRMEMLDSWYNQGAAFDVKFANNALIIHSPGETDAYAIKVFTDKVNIQPPRHFDATREVVTQYHSIATQAKFNLFQTLGIEQLDSEEFSMDLLSPEFGYIRPISSEAPPTSAPAQNVKVSPLRQRPGSIYSPMKPGSTARPGSIYSPMNPASSYSRPVSIYGHENMASSYSRPTTKFRESPDKRVSSKQNQVVPEKILTDNELEPEESGAPKIVNPEGSVAADQPDKPKDRVGIDAFIDHDSFDEGYAEINFNGIEAKTAQKRPKEGVWKFFLFHDILERVSPVNLIQKKVHICYNQFAKLSPDSSLLMIYGDKGYEIFRFQPQDKDKKALPLVADTDHSTDSGPYLTHLRKMLATKLQNIMRLRDEAEGLRFELGADPRYRQMFPHEFQAPPEIVRRSSIPGHLSPIEEEPQEPAPDFPEMDNGFRSRLNSSREASNMDESPGPKIPFRTSAGPHMQSIGPSPERLGRSTMSPLAEEVEANQPRSPFNRTHTGEDLPMAAPLRTQSSIRVDKFDEKFSRFMQVQSELNSSGPILEYEKGLETRKCFGLRLVPLRYRWKDSYKIFDKTQVEMSPRVYAKQDVERSNPEVASIAYIAICCSDYRTQILKHSTYQDVPGTRIKRGIRTTTQAKILGHISRVNIKLKPGVFCPNFYFKFSRANDDDQRMFLGRFEASANPSSHMLNLIKLDSRTSVITAEYSNEYVGTCLEMTYEEGSLGYNLLLRRYKEQEEFNHIGFKCLRSGSYDPDTVPFRTLFCRNLQYYFAADPGSISESMGYELLENTFMAISPSSILQDPRIIISMIVLNKPDLIKRVIRNIGIGSLVSNLPVLEMIFSDTKARRSNSITDIAQMYQELGTDPRDIPRLPEDWIAAVIKSTDVEGLTSNPGTKSIFSQIVFSNTGVTVQGLTSKKDLAMIKIDPQNSGTYISPFLIKSIVNPLMKENPANSNTYNIYRSQIELDLTNGSAFSIGLFQAIMQQPDDEIRYKFKQIINYKWRMVFYHSLVYTLIYLLMNVLAYLYFGYQANTAVGICLLALHGLFILFDVKLYSSHLAISAKDLKNWIDVAVHGYSAAICIITLLNLVPNQSVMSYLKIVALGVVSIRGIIQLKMFSGIRALIMLIGQIIVDLTWVPFVFVGVLLLASTIYRMIPGPNGSLETNLTFFESVQQIFLLIFLRADSVTSDVDTSTASGAARSVVLLVGGTILMQGVFNFVIAIFIQTFQRVKDDREVYELRSLLLEIVDYDLFLRGLGASSYEKGYYLFLVPVPKDGKVFENETQFDRINKIKDDILVEVGKKGIEMVGEKAKQVFKGREEYIDKGVNFVKENAKETDDRVKSLFSAAQNLAQGKKPQMSEITNLMSILGDATPDGRINTAIMKTKKAADLAFKYADDVSNSRNPGLDSLMDVVVALADAADDGSLGIGKQLSTLKELVQSCIEQVEGMANGRVDLANMMNLVTRIANTFGEKELANKISAVAGATSCVITQGENLLRNPRDVNFAVILDSVTVAIRKCGAVKIAKALEEPAYKQTAEIATILLKGTDIRGEIDVPVLIKAATKLVEVIYDDEKTKSQILMVGSACSEIYGAAQSLSGANGELRDVAKQVIQNASRVIKVFLPEQADSVGQIADVCTGVADIAQKIHSNESPDIDTILETVKPVVLLIVGKNDKYGKQNEMGIQKAIAGLAGLLKSITKTVKRQQTGGSGFASDLAADLPQLIQDGCQIAELFCKDEKSKQILKMTVLTSKLIHERMQDIGDFSSMDDVFKTTSVTLEVLCLVSPRINSKSAAIRQGLRLAERQYRNISQGTSSINMGELLEDFGELAVMVEPDVKPQVLKVVKFGKFFVEKFGVLSQKVKNNADSAEYITLACQTVEQISSELGLKVGDRIGEYCRGVSGLVRAAQEVQNSRTKGTPLDVEQVFTNASKAIKNFNEQASQMVEQSIPVFMVFKACWQENKSSSWPELEKNMLRIMDSIATADSTLKPKVDIAKSVLKAIFVCMAQAEVGSASVLDIDLDKLMSAGIGLLREIDPNVANKLEPFQKVTKALVTQVRTAISAQSKMNLKELIGAVGVVVESIRPDYGPHVNSLVKISSIIEEIVAARSLQNLGIDSVDKLIEEIGRLFAACDRRYKSSFEAVHPTIKLVLSELKKVSSLELSSKDPAGSVRNLLSTVKALLSHFRPDLDTTVLKIEWTVMGVLQQIEQCHKQGKLDIQAVTAFCADLCSQYSETVGKPARLIQGVIKVVFTLSSQVPQLESSDRAPFSDFNWEELCTGCIQIAQFFGEDYSSKVPQLTLFAKDMLKTLDQIVQSGKAGSWVFSPVMGSMSRLMRVYDQDCSEKLELWYTITKALEEEFTKDKDTAVSVLNRVSSVARILERVDKGYSVHLHTVSDFAQVLSEFLRETVSGDKKELKLTGMIALFKPFLKNLSTDQRLVHSYDRIENCIDGIEKLIYSNQISVSSVVKSLGDAVLVLYPQHDTKVRSYVTVAQLFETSIMQSDQLTKPNLEQLVDGVIGISAEFVQLDTKDKLNAALIIKKAIFAVIYTMEKFKAVSHPFAGVAIITNAATDILKVLYPKIQPSLEIVDNLIKLVEEEATRIDEWKEIKPQALVLTAHRIVSIFNPAPSSAASRVGAVLSRLELLLSQSTQLQEGDKYQMIQLALSLIAAVDPSKEMLIQKYIKDGFQLLEIAKGTDREAFIQLLKQYILLVPIPNLPAAKIEKFITAMRKALDAVDESIQNAK